jgi:hypothetical protein
MSREENRHHTTRIKNKRKHYYANWAARCVNSKRVLGILANTACVCSCTMCASPRRLYKNGRNSNTASDQRKLTDPDF